MRLGQIPPNIQLLDSSTVEICAGLDNRDVKNPVKLGLEVLVRYLGLIENDLRLQRLVS